MKEVQLTLGMVALVDDEDYEALARHKWTAQKSSGGSTFYAVRWGPGGRRNRKRILMHRVITGAVDSQDVDHKDGNGLLNTRSNLRRATRAQNAANKKIGRNNTSGYKGVYWKPKDARWQALIQPQGRCIYLGEFSDPVEAALAYDRAALEIFGEFARPNFPIGTNKTSIAANDAGLKAGLDNHA